MRQPELSKKFPVRGYRVFVICLKDGYNWDILTDINTNHLRFDVYFLDRRVLGCLFLRRCSHSAVAVFSAASEGLQDGSFTPGEKDRKWGKKES